MPRYIGLKWSMPRFDVHSSYSRTIEYAKRCKLQEFQTRTTISKPGFGKMAGFPRVQGFSRVSIPSVHALRSWCLEARARCNELGVIYHCIAPLSG